MNAADYLAEHTEVAEEIEGAIREALLPKPRRAPEAVDVSAPPAADFG